jgi:phosphatidylinositol glycan class Z
MMMGFRSTVRSPAPRGLAADALFSRARSWRIVFLFTIILRFYFALSPSYIHPDEHFQGPEAIADKVFGWATKTSWEFVAHEPVRSYASIWLAYGLPMSIFQALLGELHRLDPLVVYYGLRLALALATWVLSDMAIDRLSDTKQDRIKGLFFVASSYVTWTYQSHTFSNSIETVVLLWCLVIIHEMKTFRTTILSRNFDMALLGVLVAVGTFNRVTFPAFLIIPFLQLRKIFFRYPVTILTLIAATTFTSLLYIYIDTLLYGIDHGYVIAPLNSLLYNTDTSNLSIHGLHSRFHHILVNVPELLGPGILFLLSTRYVQSLPFQAAASGVFFLSLVPHQEARFLLPVVPLLCWCFDSTLYSGKVTRMLLVLWFIFNLAMGTIMGIFHQGGVVPAQAHIGKVLTNGTDIVVWWKTYSPPIWILGRPLGSVRVVEPLPVGTDTERYAPVVEYLEGGATSGKLSIVDLMGANTEIIRNALEAVTRTSTKNNYLVAPVASFYHSPLGSWFNFTEVWMRRSHLSLDDVDLRHISTLHPGLKIWQVESLPTGSRQEL